MVADTSSSGCEMCEKHVPITCVTVHENIIDCRVARYVTIYHAYVAWGVTEILVKETSELKKYTKDKSEMKDLSNQTVVIPSIHFFREDQEDVIHFCSEHLNG